MSLRHAFVSAIADAADATKLRPSNWGSGETDYDTAPTHVFHGGALGSLMYRDTGAVDGKSWLADVAVGSVLVSGGVGAAPAWSATPTLTSLTLTALSTATNGVIFKGADAFLHNYAAVSANGQNTFLGVLCGNFTLSPGGGAASLASANTGVGWFNLTALTTGKDNSAFGRGTMRGTTTGEFNTACGVDALMSNTTGHNNVAVGVDALQLNVDGSRNTAVGVNALVVCTTGEDNTAIGMSSLFMATNATGITAVGYAALGSYLTGFQTTAVGYTAGYSLTSGNFNTFLGNEAGNHASQLANAANSTALGNGSYTTASNQVVIGNASVTDVYLGSVSAAARLRAKAVVHTALTFATLPTGVAGQVAYITDSNTATWGATVAGGGANKVLVWFNGTNWTVAGI